MLALLFSLWILDKQNHLETKRGNVTMNSPSKKKAVAFHQVIIFSSSDLSLITYMEYWRWLISPHLVGAKKWSEDTISRWIAYACCSRCCQVGKGGLKLLMLHGLAYFYMFTNLLVAFWSSGRPGKKRV